MSDEQEASARLRWARLRFSIIGPLLAAPPAHGDLRAQIDLLAAKSYRHPTTGEAERFGASTIERWFYVAKDAADPVTALARKVPSHTGKHLVMPAKLAQALEAQYGQHPRWSFQLHYDNVLALAREDPSLGRVPSYTTLCRYMKTRGWLRYKRRPRFGADGQPEHQPRETRSFEVTHAHALWHLDFHEGSRKVLTVGGEWKSPNLLGILDDHSRLCCHLQWYLDETAETLVHGLAQAIQKRGLPRALLMDNGAAMIAHEVVEGLVRLGVVVHNTLPYSPEQNAKQEVFWAQIEGRLLPMLEGHADLTLALLNDATQAWVEQEYQRRHHDEIGTSPLERALSAPSVVRPSPSSEGLRRAFRLDTSRAVRHSDGTFTVGGIRFELPWQYRTLTRIKVRVARWDLSSVDLVDPRTGTHLGTVLPLDKSKNADGRRRVISTSARQPVPKPPSDGIAPHLRRLMAEYAATGLPPAYLPKDYASRPIADLTDVVHDDTPADTNDESTTNPNPPDEEESP
jgi:transposase InsO family protein